MNNIEEFAKVLQQFKNEKPPNIVFGTVVEVSPPKIQLADSNIILSDSNIKSLINLDDFVINTHEKVYIYLNKAVALITYLNNTKYLVLGAVV